MKGDFLVHKIANSRVRSYNIRMSNHSKNIIPEDIFSRRFHEKVALWLTIPFYIFFLVGIYLGWLTLTPQVFPRIIVLGSIPLLLTFLYFTSYKKIFPQKIGDCLQILVWISIIVAGNTYWGGPPRVDGPLFLGNILLIPFFALLLDSFLPFFIAVITGGLLLVEFLLRTSEFSFLIIIEFVFKIIILFIIAFVSSALIQKILTERKIRQELQKTYQELQKLDKAKSEFISMASHQLRTPLTAIKGYISMMIEGSYNHLPEKVKGKMQNVFHSNERLINIVNDLLDISKIELGKMELKKEKTQIEDLIEDIYQEMKPEAQKKNLKFIWQKPKIELPKIEIDSLKTRQVILSLIDNTIRYTHKGEIQIKAKKTNKRIQISVKDTGEGLTKEEQRKIFESFTRGAAGITHWIEGAGLGLYVAKRYVELHKGKIWAESKGKGKGSTFFVELPIK